MRKLFLLSLLVLFAFGLHAQTITGVVKGSDDGATLPGVTVVEKGTTNGTVTDMDGKYSLRVSDAQGTLVFSFIGYQTIEVAISGLTSINATLDIETTGLDEVVVVGYGVQKKSLVTGSISQVSGDDLQSVSNARVDQALQGRTAGVSVLPTSGAPGAGTQIRIRGTNSNGNSNPLYIVDGMKTGDINNIDPGDIASIEVLKDAASCAIYGTEGANGVILISTKSGVAGKAMINYDLMVGSQSARTNMELMNAEQYKTWMQEAGVEVSDRFGADTDWMNEVFQNAMMQKHHLSFAGGTEKTTYMISGSYLNQDGIVGGENANYERYTARINVKSEVKSWLEVGTNLNFMHSDRAYVGEDDEYRGVVNNTLLIDPLTPVVYEGTPDFIQEHLDQGRVILKDENGNYYSLTENVTGEIANPLAKLLTYNNNIEQDKIMGTAYATVKPFKGFTFTSRIGLDLAYQNQHFWSPEYYFSTESSNSVTTIDNQLNKWNTWLWENFANYNYSTGNHSIGVLAGYSAQKYQHPYYSMHSGSMISESDQYAYHTYARSRDLDQIAGTYETNTMISMFGRLSYDFGNKYMIEASVRRDGASVFPENEKYGVFPALSVGWLISNEDFFAVEAIDYLKIRASWGTNGSKANLPGNEDKEFWTFAGIRYPDANGNYLSGAQIDKLINTNLTWERTEMTDFGIDIWLMDSKLTFSADYYNKQTKDLIVLGTGPLSVGNDYPFVNGGTVTNKGMDFEIGYRNLDNPFKYGVNFNLSTLDNEVTELLVDAPVRGDNLRGYDVTWFEEGYPIWYFKGYKTDGVDDVTGAPIVVDVNGDGEISPEDQTYIGDPHADFLYGGSIFLEYKGLDLNIFLQGSKGNDIFTGWYRTDRPESNKPSYFFEERWTASNTGASFPAADNTSDYIYRSDFMIEDGSYLRIKQIQLGYTFPKEMVSKLGINSLRIYGSLDNYFTFTKYRGLDPEAGSSTNNRQGIDRGVYPAAGIALFGLSVGL